MERGPESISPKPPLFVLPESAENPSHKICWDGLERRKEMLSMIQEVHDRLNQQDHLLLEFHDAFVVHLAETKQTKDLINELLELYKGSKFLVTVFKFFVPIVAAFAALFLWVREHLK